MPPQNSGPSVTASHSFDHKRLYNKWKSKAGGGGGCFPTGSRPRLGLSLVLCILWGGNLQPSLWRQSCSDLPGGTTEEEEEDHVPPSELRCLSVARGDWQQSPWSVAKFAANLKHTSFHWAELFFQGGGREGGREAQRSHGSQKNKLNWSPSRRPQAEGKGLPVLVHFGFFFICLHTYERYTWVMDVKTHGDMGQKHTQDDHSTSLWPHMVQERSRLDRNRWELIALIRVHLHPVAAQIKAAIFVFLKQQAKHSIAK